MEGMWKMWKSTLGVVVLSGTLVAPAAFSAQVPGASGASASLPAAPIYAQRLVAQTIQSHPDLLDVIFHVTPPNSGQNIAVAAYTAKERGAKSGADDLGVMTTGNALVEVQKDGVRIGVLVQLKDKSGQPVGALGLMYPYKAGEAQAPFLRRSELIRDRIAKRINSRDALFQVQ